MPVPRRVQGLLEALERFWVQTLGQGGETGGGLRIPFVDYARGDGLAVGPGQAQSWSPSLIDEKTPWVNAFRGLWGLYAQDPIAGENAPAGPMYNRDGSVRAAWFDPLGFADLDKVPPPPDELPRLEAEQSDLIARRSELEKQIPERVEELQQLGVQLLSMQGSPHLGRQHTQVAANVEQAAAEVKALRRELAENDAVSEGVARQLDAFRQGRRIDPRGHIRKAAEPILMPKMRFGRAAELWAALSLSALFVGLVALIVVEPEDLLAWVIVLVLAIVIGESFLRGTFVRTVNKVAVILALLASVILVVHFWKWVLLGVLVGFAAFLVLERVRELRA